MRCLAARNGPPEIREPVCYCHTHASVLSVRVSAAERAILEAAAEQSRTSLSDFMRGKVLEAAETEVPGRSVVSIPANDWQAF